MIAGRAAKFGNRLAIVSAAVDKNFIAAGWNSSLRKY
jgi:hypothetical protein